ncbi:hypothetical protein K439DRAFT_1646404 [Ramaria rubella]|nr:hypothetical protein K439DRAFT_1646404 [Ramaria rubella]
MFPLPLPPNAPPAGYAWEEHDVSLLSTTTAFNTGVNRRDIFLGRNRCVICGVFTRYLLEHCHIIRDSEPEIWEDLKDRNWIPSQAKDFPRHEPRDGLLMCRNHHSLFDEYAFFIRFLPDIRKFILINYSCDPALQVFHGKAIALDIRDRYAPFPSLFIIHEMRVRGFHPFEPVAPALRNDYPWQDWIVSEQVYDNASGSFKRYRQSHHGNNGSSAQLQLLSQLEMDGAGGESSGGRTAVLNENVIADILAFTRAMPSWKACQIEGTSWAGTAEENIATYVSSIGVQDP